MSLPAHECAKRDTKGLYAAASRGDIGQLPGAGAPYDVPESPDVVATGGKDASALAQLVDLVAPPHED